MPHRRFRFHCFVHNIRVVAVEIVSLTVFLVWLGSAGWHEIFSRVHAEERKTADVKYHPLMADPQQAVAWAKFEAFRKNLPREIDEDAVSEFNAVIEGLQTAFGHELSAFRIADGDLKNQIVAISPGTRRHPGSARYSDKRYCDHTKLQRQIDGIIHYFQYLEPLPEAPRKPEYGF